MQAHPGVLILPYRGILPTIHPDAFIAPGAVVIGDVHIGAESNIWFGVVIRGDMNIIRIGERTNIQDGSIVHVTRETGPTHIGSNITIGHQVLLHAVTLQDGCFIGMGSTLIDGVVVEPRGFVAAGSMVTPGKRVPSGQMWAGNPAKYFRDLKQSEIDYIPQSVQYYVDISKEYKAQHA